MQDSALKKDRLGPQLSQADPQSVGLSRVERVKEAIEIRWINTRSRILYRKGRPVGPVGLLFGRSDDQIV
jgi:hypothetical protein